MITVPATAVSANSTKDVVVSAQCPSVGIPMLLAPAGASLDASWASASWIAWTESDGIRVRITNPTAGALNLAAQQFEAFHIPT